MNNKPETLDSIDCEREPIHTSDAIQAAGAMLVLTEDGRVQRASANLSAILNIPVEQALHAHLSDLIGAERAAHIDKLFINLSAGSHRATTVLEPTTDAATTLCAIVHRWTGQRFLELQREDSALEMPAVADLSATLQLELASSQSVFLCAKRVTHSIAEATDYARVMVYRFHSDWSGEVIAESRRPELTPYLGLRYPASDIPSPARKLYELNRVRVIADVNAASVAMLAATDSTHVEPLDMTYATLRSVPPTHIEYLRNMGVGATLSSAIMVDNKLWGMIACHHDEPRIVPWSLRDAFARASEIFGARLTVLLQRERSRYQERLDRNLTQLQETALTDDNFVHSLLQFSRSEVSRGGGCVLLCGTAGAAMGLTPPLAWCRRLADWLATQSTAPLFVTHQLPSLWHEADMQRSSASGLAALRVAAEPNAPLLLCFRPEIVREVDWGGDPTQPFERDAQTQRISPRKSFALWRETVRGESRPWEAPVIELLTRLPALLANWLSDPLGTLQRHTDAFGPSYQQQEPSIATYLEGAAPEGMALLMVSEPQRLIRPLSVNQAFQDTFGLDFTALDGLELSNFLDALGLPQELLNEAQPNQVIECDSWSDFRGQRNLLIERKRYLETQQADTAQSWAVLVFQDITDLSREREALQAAREHALLTAETLEQQVAERTRDLQQEIVERKRAEQALENQRANLENLVRERTAHLSELNQQLQTEIAERKKAERARERLLTELRRSNEALEHFAYIASHDLQEPVRKIRQFGERLLDDPQSGLPGKAHDYVGRIHHSATYAQQLIRDLLAYSRITQRAQPFKAVALDEVVARVIKSLEQQVAHTAAQIDVASLPTVWGDRNQLFQVFQNLLENALKFRRPEVPPRIQIHCVAEADASLSTIAGNSDCRIVVSDNGIGFEPRFSEQIFDVFHRLHDRRQYSGTGIGLAICKKIIDFHGGRIEAHSKPGQGTVFTFTLPLRPALRDDEATAPLIG